MRDYCNKSKRFSILFIATCGVVVISFFLQDWQWLTDRNYHLHEMLSLPILAGCFLIPIEIIVGMVILVRYQKTTSKSEKKPLNAVLNVLSVFSLSLCILTVSYFTGRTITTGWESDLQKYEISQGFYVRVSNMEIQVGEQLFISINDDSPCQFSYVHGKWIGGEYYQLTYLKADDE